MFISKIPDKSALDRLIAKFGQDATAEILAILGPKPKARADGGGAAFAAALGIARARLRAECGEQWYLRSDLWRYGSVPAALASYKTAGGITIRMRRDQRIPNSEYWPGGVIPTALDLAAHSVAPHDGSRARDMMRVFDFAKGQRKREARAARLLPADSVSGRLNRAGELRRAGYYAAARDELRAVRDWPGVDCGA